MNIQTKKRLHSLLERLCDDQLSGEKKDELESILENNEEAQIQYIRYMEMHGRLARLLTSSQGAAIHPAAISEADLNAGRAAQPPSKAIRSRRLIWIGFIAASLLGIIAWNFQRTDTFVARVVKKIDCDSESARWGKQQGGDLVAGHRITLRSGLLALEFGCGATVAIEGPAEFEIVSAKKGILHFGNLTANAPEGAEGFAIETPSCESVDLGTSFGVRVNAEGGSETHVFEGEVHVFDKGQSGKTSANLLKLTASEASRVDSTLVSATQFEANPSEFVRLPQQLEPESIWSHVPFNRADAPVLWFDASKQVQTDGRYRVVSWGDLTATGQIDRHDAWQVNQDERPFLIPDGLNGHHAIRFMGSEYLLTEPLESGNNITVFLVGKLLPSQLRVGQRTSIVSFGAAQNLILERQHRNYLRSKVLGKWVNGQQRTSGSLSTTQDMTNIPVVMAMVYNREENHSELHINGERIGRADAWLPVACQKSRYIGCRSEKTDCLVGDLAEIIVFDSVLGTNKLAATSDWLREKYTIERGLGLVDTNEVASDTHIEKQ